VKYALFFFKKRFHFMAVNNFAGRRNVYVARTEKSFAAMGFDASNTAVIYVVSRDAIKSWVPGRAINPITGQNVGSVYWCVRTGGVDMDLTLDCCPPLPVGGVPLYLTGEETPLYLALDSEIV
jgi:hypothetical protein